MYPFFVLLSLIVPERSLELIYCPKSAINLDLGEYFCDAHIRVEIKAAHGFTVWASNSKNGTTTTWKFSRHLQSRI